MCGLTHRCPITVRHNYPQTAVDVKTGVPQILLGKATIQVLIPALAESVTRRAVASHGLAGRKQESYG